MNEAQLKYGMNTYRGIKITDKNIEQVTKDLELQGYLWVSGGKIKQINTIYELMRWCLIGDYGIDINNFSISTADDIDDRIDDWEYSEQIFETLQVGECYLFINKDLKQVFWRDVMDPEIEYINCRKITI